MSNDTPIQIAQADRIILQQLRQTQDICCDLDETAGAVLRETIVAERDQPPFDRVTMDGIALNFQSTSKTRMFSIQSVQHAGDPPHTLIDTKSCIEVMTGAHLPIGCDCVIPLEVYDKDKNTITLNADYQAGLMRNVHPRGSDQKNAQPLLQPGLRINAPEMAILASAGMSQVRISKPLSIAILSTGSELVDIQDPIEDYQIRRSNDRSLATALKQAGFGNVSRYHLVDEPEPLKQKIKDLLVKHDSLVISGGVSKGVKDYVPGILAELGVNKHFHRVAQRPGKPLWFGTTSDNKTVFGLPGNPVSSLVCLVRYVIPAYSFCLGLAPKTETWVTLTQAVDFKPELTWFLPVTLKGNDQYLGAEPRLTNTSGDFVSLAGTDGFVELAATTNHFPEGYRVRFYSW